MSNLPRLGFIGVGTIAEALITGMCVGGEQRATFFLSPRNSDTAQRLAERYAFVAVARDNQAVIDGSDIVFLAVRPQVAPDVLGALKFRPDQRIVSLIAGFDVARLRSHVAPVTAIARATPMPAVARRLGPLTLYPPVPEVARLLEGLGQLVQLEHESDLDALWAVTGLMGSYFGFLNEIAGWLSRQNLEDAQIRPYLAAVFEALGVTAAERAEEGFDRLIVEHSTPGGLNEQAYRELKAAGWTSLISQALDLVHARVLGRATLADRLPPRADQHDSQVSFKR
jgi:pyrroline-5-carboxylate reductase